MYRDERTNFKFKMAEVLTAWLMNPQLRSSAAVLGREPTAGHMRQAMYESVSCYSKLNQQERNAVLGLFALMLEKVGHAWAIDPAEVSLRQELQREQQSDRDANESVRLSRTEGMQTNKAAPMKKSAKDSAAANAPGRLAGDGRLVVLLAKLAAVEIKLVLDGVADVLPTFDSGAPEVTKALVMAQRTLSLCCLILQCTITFLVAEDDGDDPEAVRSWGRLPGEVLVQLQPTLTDSFTVIVQFLDELKCMVPAAKLQARGLSGGGCNSASSSGNIMILREVLETAVGAMGFWLSEESVGDSGLQQNVRIMRIMACVERERVGRASGESE
jgi:hypothetical protein